MARVTLIFGVALFLAFCHCSLLASGQITHPSEVRALEAVRHQLIDPNKVLNWTKKTDPCTTNWTGVFCIIDTTDGYLHVDELRMLHLGLFGQLAPELGQLSNLTILNFMWNNITGSIPKELGNIIPLKLLLLSGNQLSGPLPDELGYLTKLQILQLDDNNISGSLPKSFANMTGAKHFHMNNNSITGQIPPEISALTLLLHFLLDNNNLSGYLPPEFSRMPSLKIIQLDNNNFGGTEIPPSYGNISKLVKLSLRNCSLTGPVPDLSNIGGLRYVDLSSNQLTGEIPTNRLSDSITAIILYNNMLNGSIPSSFSGLPSLQKLSLENNFLSGDVPSSLWQNVTLNDSARLILDFQNNSFTNISGSIDLPMNVSIRLNGNPVCRRANQLNIVPFCGLEIGDVELPGSSSNSSDSSCKPQSCPASENFQYVPGSPVDCFCAAPLGVSIRLRSPTMSDFRPSINLYELYITSNLGVNLYQLFIDSFIWEKGPRLALYLKIFPQYIDNSTSTFNFSEIHRVIDLFATYSINSSDIFGPYELLNFTLLGPYRNVLLANQKSGMSKGALVGIILGSISSVCTVALSLAFIFIFYRRRNQIKSDEALKKQPTVPKIPIKTGSVKDLSFMELEAATSGFNFSTQVGQGGYGRVYKGILADGTVVAIKRARQGSIQSQTEFITEIELLSRLHHRNLVSLVGYCDEQGEQMLVYEYMPNGSLHDLLSDRSRNSLSFPMRLGIALGSAKGILYLHNEADPPIIHRDIKANNILLDYKLNPKVSDFGISRLAPATDGGALAHISTNVKGTPGYLDPEYFLTHKLTDKSDVYSLGIVFLELLTGMQPISHGRNIVREVYAACESGMMFSIIDQNMGPYPSECVKKFMALALKCCQDKPKDRPSMLEVVRELENLCSLLPDPDIITSESDASTSGASGGHSASLVYSSRNSYVSTEFRGSELVSGVIPTIRPR